MDNITQRPSLCEAVAPSISHSGKAVALGDKDKLLAVFKSTNIPAVCLHLKSSL